MYACWNLRCPKYAGKGVNLWRFEVRAADGDEHRCKTCGGQVRKAIGFDVRFWRLLAGAVGGGSIGGAVGGQTGSYIGAALGVVLMAIARS